MIVIVIDRAIVIAERATIAASDWADINKAQRAAAAEERTGCERTRVQ